MIDPEAVQGLTRTQQACLIAGPAVLIVARILITPFRDKGETAGYLTAIAKGRTISDVGAVLGILGALLLIPAFVGLGRVVSERMPRLGWLAVGLAVVGSVAMSIVAMLAIMGAQIGQVGSTGNQVEVWNKAFSSGPGSAVGQLMLACGAAGSILLAVGLYRSGVVRHAAAVLVGIGGASTMFTAPGPVRVVLITAAALALAGFVSVVASTPTATAHPAAPTTGVLAGA
jgi:hypothetical protein